jgi:hypothetical protein
MKFTSTKIIIEIDNVYRLPISLREATSLDRDSKC